MAKTFDPLRPGDEETFTIDLATKAWLQSGETVTQGAADWSTAETGVTILQQNWSDGGTKANVKVRAVTARKQAYPINLVINTNMRKRTKTIYIPVSSNAG